MKRGNKKKWTSTLVIWETITEVLPKDMIIFGMFVLDKKDRGWVGRIINLRKGILRTGLGGGRNGYR